MWRSSASLLASIVFVYLGLCVALFVFQRSLIYYPQPSAIANPATLLKLAVADADLRVSVRPLKGAKALIYLGGNAEDVSLVVAEHDEVIPRASTDSLHSRFGKGIASLEMIPATSHNTISESPRYLQALKAAL